MPIVQFSHANGFPASTYQYLFDQLPEYEFRYLERLGHGKIPFRRDFENLATELILTVAAYGEPVIGMGHSLGGVVTTLAAARRPDLFSQVILLDPPFFSGWKRLIIRALQSIGQADNLGPTKKAMVRRTHFASREEAREYFAQKAFFQRFHPETFEAYIQKGLTDTDTGLELSISREFEVSVFRTIQTRKPAGFRDLKGTLIYGEKSDLVWPSDVRWWRRAAPDVELVKVTNGGHLIPLEEPEKTARLIRSALTPEN